MLQVKTPDLNLEFFDDDSGTFSYESIQGVSLQLEHSLVSLARWESKWKKPFLGKEDKTTEETLDYIRCMTITPKIVEPRVYTYLPSFIIAQVQSYIDDKMTATWFGKEKTTRNQETVTAEIIYYWMIAHNIPFECQKWHLNRLLTLIRVCNVKNTPQKKKNRREEMANRRAQNEARRAKFNSKG